MTRYVKAERMKRGAQAYCPVCWFEHGKAVTAKSKVRALRHLETEHPWYWEIRGRIDADRDDH